MHKQHPAHARYLVRMHYGRTALDVRYFTTYRSARRYARGIRRGSVRLLLTEREHAGLYALACVALLAMFVRALGA